ncbi:unnamed protein product [Plutella xylostella]|uniref:(diamondback moth) hypothetical protein n=1 Tax=Plutella xylostella TaxID=51655 RepID=A0A8S4G748_PLUXY|nr:unnamed protein product [Plutella xylostella]
MVTNALRRRLAASYSLREAVASSVTAVGRVTIVTTSTRQRRRVRETASVHFYSEHCDAAYGVTLDAPFGWWYGSGTLYRQSGPLGPSLLAAQSQPRSPPPHSRREKVAFKNPDTIVQRE